MKNIKIIVVLLLVSVVCPAIWGQYRQIRGYVRVDDYRVLDYPTLTCSYLLTSVKDPAKPEEKSEDMQILQIGSRVSKCYSQYYVEHSGEALRLMKNGAQVIPGSVHKGYYGYEVFKNYPSENKVTVTELGYFLGAKYIYEEDAAVFDWQLHDEFMDLLGHNCQKATVSFRGREWTAWFAADIAASGGPWKFGGLPGIILRIYDSQHHYVWDCVGIDRALWHEPIKFYNIDFTRISRKELDMLFREMHKNEAAYMRSAGGGIIRMMPDGTSAKENNSPQELPYNPIERE
jgi:GLPGLI family protein